MRVAIPIPGQWPAEETERGRIYAVPERDRGELGPAWILASRLVPVPPIFTAEWANRQLARGLQADARLVIRESSERASARGWPVTLYRCEVRGPDGSTLEHRIVLAYRFLYFFGTAELRASEPLAEVEHLVDLLLKAMPDFSEEVACLAHIYGFDAGDSGD